MMRKTLIVNIFAIAILGVAVAYGIEPRIAGLRSNAAYMSLLEEDAVLQHREDSLVNALSEMRAMFRLDREKFNPDVLLSLEEDIFDVRSRRGDITVRINIIEQEWVLNNYSTQGQGKESEEEQSGAHVKLTYAESNNPFFIDNLCFERALSDGDYAVLHLAQQSEEQAAKIAERYKVLYDSLVNYKAEYEMATTIEQGAPIFEKFNRSEAEMSELADSLYNMWTYAFDNKTYSYALLLENASREDLIDQGAESANAKSAEAANLYGEYISDELVDYSHQRQAILDYELLIAEQFGLVAAVDSLRRVASDEKSFEYRLPHIEMKERLFLDYQPVDFASPAIYSAQNPIPECVVYERGTIYRLLLGTFWSKQSVSLFKGVYPLGFLKMNSKHLYFAGGYATKAEAEEAVKILKKRGFKNPVVVRWKDGEYRNLSTDPEPEAQTKFRVELITESLSQAQREAIVANADGREMTRAGESMFVIGSFDQREQAQKLVDALRIADGQCDVKIEEIVVQ